MKRAVFICLTPLHLFKAINIQEQYNKKGYYTLLVWKKDFNIDVDINYYASKFDEIVEVKNRYKSNNGFIKFYYKLFCETIFYNKSKIYKQINKKYDSNEIIVFNDIELLTYRILKQCKSSKITIVEEGKALYIDKPVKSTINLMVNEFLFRQKRFDYIKFNIGSYKKINTIIAKNIDELPSTKKEGKNLIEEKNFFDIGKENIFYKNLEKSLYWKEFLNNVNGKNIILYLGQNQTELNIKDKKVFDVLDGLIKQLKYNELLVIKPHSRENKNKYNRYRKYNNCIILDDKEFSWYPAEILIRKMNIQKIINIDTSTVIGIENEIKVESIYNKLK